MKIQYLEETKEVTFLIHDNIKKMYLVIEKKQTRFEDLWILKASNGEYVIANTLRNPTIDKENKNILHCEGWCYGHYYIDGIQALESAAKWVTERGE